MKKLMLMLILLLSLGVVVGCGGGDAEQVEKADPATQAEPAAEVQVATHDCDGGCGMTNVPTEKMTERDGKFYCAGCAAKLPPMEEATDAHDGHNH